MSTRGLRNIRRVEGFRDDDLACLGLLDVHGAVAARVGGSSERLELQVVLLGDGEDSVDQVFLDLLV